MQHKYPFTALHITINPELLDVNVHPSKMELRFSNEQDVYNNITECVREALAHKEIIPEFTMPEKQVTPILSAPYVAPATPPLVVKDHAPVYKTPEPFEVKRAASYNAVIEENIQKDYKQLELFDRPNLLDKKNEKNIKIIGQIFDTYWIIEFEGSMYIVDQHAAHEKVLYERFMKIFKEQEIHTQQISPPIILSLSMDEQNYLKTNLKYLEEMGYELEEFGGEEYAIRGIPDAFSVADPKELVMEIIDSFSEDYGKNTPESIKDRIATMSCKAAVKGNNRMSYMEAGRLINELMDLENPYNCPHGRPTMITMTKYELEKKFKRII